MQRTNSTERVFNATLKRMGATGIFVKATATVAIICSKEHKFTLKPSQVMEGRWCSQCGYKTRKDYDAIIAKYGATTSEYKSVNMPTQITCKQGHRFALKPCQVMLGQWCAHCEERNVMMPKEKPTSPPRDDTSRRGPLEVFAYDLVTGERVDYAPSYY
ncbi:Hypothetical protein POVN_LOCUS681 [uncultured virus]|nr:Hypothetical protein POVN_LOCUS681 [uncultured virus]